MSLKRWRKQPAEPVEPSRTQLEELVHTYIVAVMASVSERAALDRELRHLSERNNP